MLSRSTTFSSQPIQTDGTFGLAARFFKKRAVFKKMSMNKQGQVAVPKAESDALELNHNQPVNVSIIQLDTNFTATARNIEVKKDTEGYFTFVMPDSVEQQLGGVDFEMSAPLQFVLSPVGLNFPNPANEISQLENRRRGQYTASKFLVYKSYVSEDNRGPFVTVEKNERDFFEVDPGDTLSITTIPIKGGKATDSITRFFNNDIRAQVENATSTEGAKSVKVYIGNLLSAFDYKAGTLVQVIGVKV